MRCFLLLATLAALAGSTPSAHAGGHDGGHPHTPGRPLLVVHRTEDVSDCPDARALAAMVAEHMKRPALEPAFDLPPGEGKGLDVQIYRSGQGFTAVIQAGGKTRQLSDKGATCSGLAGALAVSIAVLLDTELPPPEPEPEPPAPARPPPPAPPAREEARASPGLALPPTPTPPEEDAPAPRKVRVSLAAAPVLTVGVLQGFAGGVASEVELRVGRFTIAAGVLVLPGDTYSLSNGQVKLDLTAAMVRACGIVAGDEPMRFVLCVEPMAGAIRGTGQGFTIDRTANLPWGGAATSAMFQQKIWGPLSWGARAGLVVPLAKTMLSVNNVGTAFTAAPIGGAWNAELRVSIW